MTHRVLATWASPHVHEPLIRFFAVVDFYNHHSSFVARNHKLSRTVSETKRAEREERIEQMTDDTSESTLHTLTVITNIQ